MVVIKKILPLMSCSFEEKLGLYLRQLAEV